MQEQGPVQGCIISSAPQRRGEECVFEYFFFSKNFYNIEIFLVNWNVKKWQKQNAKLKKQPNIPKWQKMAYKLYNSITRGSWAAFVYTRKLCVTYHKKWHVIKIRALLIIINVYYIERGHSGLTCRPKFRNFSWFGNLPFRSAIITLSAVTICHL
jgi:hypothetical protein